MNLFWYQRGINVVSTWYQRGINVVSTWYQRGINVVSTWYQRGINVVTTLYRDPLQYVKPYEKEVFFPKKNIILCIIIYYELVCEITHLK